MKRVLGLVSGTSMDGVDAAVIEIDGKGVRTRANLRHFLAVSYPKSLATRILRLSENHPLPVRELCQLNFLVGEFFARAALRACREAGLAPEDVDLIGSHGQTVQHIPGRGGLVCSTLQIGEPAVIAERTGITTVADFRPADIAHGGVGAPLTPYVHWLLFRHPKKPRSIHNLGGISNLTYLRKGAGADEILAFDTGPANVLMDTYVRHLTGGKTLLDQDGRKAAQGRVIERVFTQLLRHPFLKKPPPKSTGREEFGHKMVASLVRKTQGNNLEAEDVLATLAGFTARSIGDAYRRFVLPRGDLDEIFFCGGGRRNVTLMEMIKREVPFARVRLIDELGVDGDALEAVTFGILAHEAVEGQALTLRSVTGAKSPAILGKIVPGKNFRRASLGPAR
jgi:anhydro-N-acetylmuramic acid kinase